jgi:hypothetical protein
VTVEYIATTIAAAAAAAAATDHPR